MPYVLPTLKDMQEGVKEEPQPSVKSKYANPRFEDMGITVPKAAPSYDWGGSEFQVGPWKTGLTMSPEVEQFLAGAGHSFASVGRSAKQLTGNYSQEQALSDAVTDKPLMDTGWGTAGDITGNIAMSLAVPVGGLSGAVGKGIAKAGMAKAGSAAAKSMLLDAALSGGLSANMRPVLPNETRLSSTLTGMGSGALFYGATKPLFGAAGKTANIAQDKWDDVGAQATDKLGRNYGVELDIGGVTKSPGWQMFEDASQEIPFSTRRQNMQTQAGQIQDMLASFREDVRPSLTVSDARGTVLKKYGSSDEMMVGELQRNFKNLVAEKDALFDNVGKVIAKNPKAKPVVFNATKSEVKKLLDSHPDVFDKFRDVDSPLLAKLQGLDENMSVATGVLNSQGKPFTRTAQSSYEDAQWLRKRLGSLAEAARKQSQSGAITDDAAGQIKQVYKAVNNDLDNWGKDPANEAVHKAYKGAQDFYKENIVPFKTHPVLKKVVNEHAPYDFDVASKEFFKAGRGNLAQDIMRFQTPEGKKAAQFTMVDEMIEKALNPNKDGLDISGFLTHARRMDDPASKVFEPATLSRIQDMETILRAGSRAGNYLDSGGSGARYAGIQAARTLGPALAGGTLAGGIASGGMTGGLATAGLLGGGILTTRALNKMGVDPMGKRILMSSSKLPGGLQYLADVISTKAGGPTIYNALHNGAAEEITPEMFRNAIGLQEDDPMLQ